MTTTQKNDIITAAMQYMRDNDLTNTDVSRSAKINPGYLSNMLRHQYSTVVEGKDVPIGDKWFIQLAEYAGFSIEKQYWSTVLTRQFKEGIKNLESCKNGGKTGLIIGGTGFGKTDFINTFCKKNPLHTYRVTVSSLSKLVNIINELCEKTGVDLYANNANRPNVYSLKLRVDLITEKLKEIKRNGGLPIIIFDEGENLEISVLKMLKALYDGLKDYCSIVIIGTEQLMNKLLNLKKRNRDAIPQLYRRFKAGYQQLTDINKHEEYPKFFDKMGVADKDLASLLTDISDNYGELHDYLEPVLREADIKGLPITENLFRLYHNMKKK